MDHDHHKNPREPDPYSEGIVTPKLRIIKDPIHARASGILTNSALQRKMNLIPSPSRAVRSQDVHELVCTSEYYSPGEVVRDVSYLAFIVFEESGVLAVGDLLIVGDKEFGKIIGFNEAHAPNHINIVIYVNERITGLQAGWQPGTALIFSRAFEVSNPYEIKPDGAGP